MLLIQWIEECWRGIQLINHWGNDYVHFNSTVFVLLFSFTSFWTYTASSVINFCFPHTLCSVKDCWTFLYEHNLTCSSSIESEKLKCFWLLKYRKWKTISFNCWSNIFYILGTFVLLAWDIRGKHLCRHFVFMFICPFQSYFSMYILFCYAFVIKNHFYFLSFKKVGFKLKASIFKS